jgi:hypothetical protein
LSRINPVEHFTATDVPEPSTWAMLALGFVGLGAIGYRSSYRGYCEAPF